MQSSEKLKSATAILLGKIEYAFKNPTLLRQSLTHKSYDNENPNDSEGHNERLEFLGDAVLELVISDFLMEAFPNLSEGDLSKLRANLVSESSLAEIAREISLGDCILIGKGEETSGGRDKNSILSDTLEAFFAAIYLDSRENDGIQTIGRVIYHFFATRLKHAKASLGNVDFKTELQELVQKQFKDTVRYLIIKEDGPDHDKEFEAAVIFKEKEYGRGIGHTKKQAEQEAAKQAIKAFSP